SHRRTLVSAPAVASILPSGEKATDWTALPKRRLTTGAAGGASPACSANAEQKRNARGQPMKRMSLGGMVVVILLLAPGAGICSVAAFAKNAGQPTPAFLANAATVPVGRRRPDVGSGERFVPGMPSCYNS